METCPDCGCRVYALGCTNCNEPDYIEAQEALDELNREPETLADRKEPTS